MATKAPSNRSKPLSKTKVDSAYAGLLAKYAPRPIRTETEYRRLLKLAKDFTRPDIGKAEHMFLDLIGGLIETYEEQRFPIPASTPQRILAHLLEERGMSQSAFAREMGLSRQMVSDIVNERRQITAEHVGRFARYFGVSPAVFIPQA